MTTKRNGKSWADITEAMDEDSELWWLILQTRRAMARVREKELATYDVTPEEASILFCCQALRRQATPAEISRWLLREPHSVSTLVSRMEKAGLVEKVNDLDRKNLVRVVPTKKGRQAYRGSTKEYSIHRLLSVLNKKHRQQLRTTLNILRDKAYQELGMVNSPPLPY